MAEGPRLFSLAFHAISILVLLVRVLPLSLRAPPAERSARGATRFLPLLLLPMGFLVPPIAMLTRTGQMDVAWRAVRIAGLMLGLYAAVILPWAASTLGGFLVPQARVSGDHELVVAGPFRFVRHPANWGAWHSGWLGSALATANLLLRTSTVLEHDRVSLTCRIGNERVVMRSYVPVHGMVVRQTGDRGVSRCRAGTSSSASRSSAIQATTTHGPWRSAAIVPAFDADRPIATPEPSRASCRCGSPRRPRRPPG